MNIISDSQKRLFRIIGLYILSVVLLYIYWSMDNSIELKEFLKKAERSGPQDALGFYAEVGLIQYGSLIAGISIPIILTTLLILNRNKDL